MIPIDGIQSHTAFRPDPFMIGAVLATALPLTTMLSLLGRIQTTPEDTDADVLRCPHCGWHAIIVRSESYEDGRAVRISHERHPDRRATVETECPVRGAYWIRVREVFRWLPVDAPPDLVESAVEGYARGLLFRLIEVESRYPEKPSASELARREIFR